MKTTRTEILIAAALVGALAFTTTIARAALSAEASAKAGAPLPSWNDGKAKKSVIEFVAKVTKPGSPDFVPVPERIATFDNDGTLWCEQPMPVQFYFALVSFIWDRISNPKIGSDGNQPQPDDFRLVVGLGVDF